MTNTSSRYGRSVARPRRAGASSLAQKSGRFMVVMRDVDGAVLGAVVGDLGGPLGRLDDGVVVAGDDVVPVPAAVDERLERQLEGERAARRPSSVVAGVDALRAAVGHRPVDGDRWRRAPASATVRRDVGDDRSSGASSAPGTR